MTIEITAKKVEDAISQGLAQLGATADEVNVEVLDLGGLFRKAKVRLTLEREEKTDGKAAEPEKKTEQKPQAPKAEEKAAPEKKAEPAPKSEQAAEKKPEQKKQKAKPEPKAEKEHKPEQKPEPKPEQAAPHRNAEADKAAAEHAVEFIKEVVAKMGFAEATVEAGEDGLIEITAPPHDDSLLIGRHGETLSALSYIAETCARAEKCRINVTVDCNGYRERRAASLTAMAKRRANECVARNRKIKLEAMERIDRRTIHNALTDDERVTTASEGKEPFRYVVILPKKNH